MASIAHSKNITDFLSENGLEQLRLQHTLSMNAKINMDAVIAEFKERLAYEKKCFQSISKREQREVRSQRKVFNQYVEQIITDWRSIKSEETACETTEWLNLGIDRWDTRNPPSNIFQIEHALEMPESEKKWLFSS